MQATVIIIISTFATRENSTDGVEARANSTTPSLRKALRVSHAPIVQKDIDELCESFASFRASEPPTATTPAITADVHKTEDMTVETEEVNIASQMEVIPTITEAQEAIVAAITLTPASMDIESAEAATPADAQMDIEPQAITIQEMTDVIPSRKRSTSDTSDEAECTPNKKHKTQCLQLQQKDISIEQNFIRIEEMTDVVIEHKPQPSLPVFDRLSAIIAESQNPRRRLASNTSRRTRRH